MKALVRFLLLCFFLLSLSGYAHAFVRTASSSGQSKSIVHVTGAERHKCVLLNDILSGEPDLILNVDDEDEENEEHNFSQDILLSLSSSFLADSVNPVTGIFCRINPAFFHKSPIYIAQRVLRI